MIYTRGWERGNKMFERGTENSTKCLEQFFNNKGYAPKSISTKIAGIYMTIGILWILLSDKIVEGLVFEKEAMMFISMVKGWVYVAVTGFVIYRLVYSALSKVKNTEAELIKSYRDLSSANDEIASAYGQLTASEELLRQQYEELIENQKQLMISESRYRLISEAANDAIWEERDDRMFFSDRWYEITGYDKRDLEHLGDWKVLIHPEDKTAAEGSRKNHIKNKTSHYQCEYRLRTKSGEYKWIQARGKALFGTNGKINCMVGSHTDISELKEYEKKLHQLAYHDQLTGLKNRVALTEQLSGLIEEKKNKKMALLFIDIDNFKYVNDTMGHTFGDYVLKEVGNRLSTFQSETSFLYRLGGDEFIILINAFDEMNEVEKIAVNILKTLKNAVEIEGSSIFNTVSIGVSIFPEHGSNMDELLKNADIAVHKAKEAGKDKIIIYNVPMNEAVTERMRIERNLRRALQKNEFELHYQPQLDIKTNKISGFEALIRWRNEELGFVSPAKFISIAEDTHMILPIGIWVLRNACLFLKRLHLAGYLDLTISVNVSMLQLLQDDFVEVVTDALELTKLSPKYMELEITESILMESYETIARKLKLLRGRGVKIALDDFGKGYSSLNYLRHLPISTLKIDKTFIDTIQAEGKNKSLADLIVKLGRSMDLCVVAEGVETKEQMDYLIKHKCHKIQGYLFSKPLPENEVIEKMRSEI